MCARSAVLLALTAVCVAATPARAATDAQLLRRHAPVLVLDAREPGPPLSIAPFLRGARGAAARAAPPRVYGHSVSDGGRRWLQYWLFHPDNPQDRGIVRSGRHEARGDGARVRPPVTVIADDRPAWVASRMRWGASRAA